jgi:hypothetical protein
VNRAAAIKSVHVAASWEDPEGTACKELLESQLPFLAGCLAKHGARLELTLGSEEPTCPTYEELKLHLFWLLFCLS